MFRGKVKVTDFIVKVRKVSSHCCKKCQLSSEGFGGIKNANLEGSRIRAKVASSGR